MTNYQRTAAWLNACGKVPGHAGDISIQIGCHLEEFSELLRCLRLDKPDGQAILDRTEADMELLALKLKRLECVAHIPSHLRVEALDALCDAEVTANGVAYLTGFDKDAADQAVITSNDAKLVDGKPVLLPGGKIGKPEGWCAPDLSSFV